MSEISETEIKSMTKEQNYMRGYEDGKSDVLDKIRAEIKEESRFCPLTEGLERALEIIDKYTAEETWEGIHAQVTAPKGTFDKIWNEAEDNDEI